jgi:hypothetical protein
MAMGCEGCKQQPHTEKDCDFSVEKGYERGQCTCQHREGCTMIEVAGETFLAPPGVKGIVING